MNLFTLKYIRFGERSLLIEWPQKICKEILKDILQFKSKIQKSKLSNDIRTSYNSMVVNFKKIDDELKTISDLKKVYSSKNLYIKEVFYTWEIPICYDIHIENDIKNLEINLSLEKDKIFSIHRSSTYLIYNIGFLPGFIYLGGMDKRIHHPRKEKPSLNIPKGAVGIGGSQTGIYPNKSPGGWYIIGNCPVDFFDVKKTKPCFVKPGDHIKFKMISKQEYDSIKNVKISNEFDLKKTINHD